VEDEWILGDSLKLNRSIGRSRPVWWVVDGGTMQGGLVAFILLILSSGTIGFSDLKRLTMVLLLVVAVGCWRGAIVCERFGLMSEVIRDVGGLVAQVLQVQGSFWRA
jgi:hypothetical protein